jgi:hypothetical protein
VKYDYSIVRFVPDSFRGEFINVAVIAGSAESGEWAIRWVQNPQRARRLDGGARLDAVFTYLYGIDALLERKSEEQLELDPDSGDQLDSAWLYREHERLGNLVQLTAPAPVIAEDVDQAIAQVFDVFVVDPERRTRRTKAAAISALRNAFADAELPQQALYDRGVRAVVGRQQVAIDFAVANGNLVQLAHGWSFQSNEPTITVQQIKAWSWTLRDVRDGEGIVQVRDRGELRSYDVPENVAIDVVYVPPETDEGRRSLDEALEVFDHLQVTALSVLEAGRVGEQARQLLERSELKAGGH